MIRFNHIVLLFRKEAMLRRIQACQLTPVKIKEDIPAVTQMMIGGCLIAEQSQPFTQEIDITLCQIFKTNCNHYSTVTLLAKFLG